MAKATKTAATKTAAKKTTHQAKPGSTPAKTAAADAANKADAGYDAKANAVKSKAEGKAGKDPERRYVVAEGRNVRSKGVRFTAGEAIDLPQSDGERLKLEGVLIDDDGGETAKTVGDDDSNPATGEDGKVPLAPGDAAPAVGDAGTTPPAGDQQ